MLGTAQDHDIFRILDIVWCMKMTDTHCVLVLVLLASCGLTWGQAGIDCYGGQVYNYCGSPCTKTCDDPDPSCIEMCAEKCECPDDAPIWHNSQCIKVEKCPPPECSERCENGGTCWKGTCYCDPEYTGEYCETWVGTSGGSVKNCSHCIYDECDDMEQCPYGCMDTNYYGMSCDMPCNDECIPEYWSEVKCDGKSGACLHGCKNGTHGLHCDLTCPKGCNSERCDEYGCWPECVPTGMYEYCPGKECYDCMGLCKGSECIFEASAANIMAGGNVVMMAVVPVLLWVGI